MVYLQQQRAAVIVELMTALHYCGHTAALVVSVVVLLLAVEDTVTIMSERSRRLMGTSNSQRPVTMVVLGAVNS